MKMLISEIAKRTGVSVRTLHYYDSIGLLKPAEIDGSNGYRYYDEGSIEQLNEILYYRGLDFPLRDIPSLLQRGKHTNSKLLRQRGRLMEELQRIQRQLSDIDRQLAEPPQIEPWFDKVLRDYNYSGFVYIADETPSFFAWGTADSSGTPFGLNSRFAFDGLSDLLCAYCGAEGLPFKDALRSEIFEPLGMTDTSFGGDIDVIGNDTPCGNTLISTAEDIAALFNAIFDSPKREQLVRLIGGDIESGTFFLASESGGVFAELSADIKRKAFTLSVRNCSPKPDGGRRVMYYPISGCDDGWVKLELWNMQTGSAAEVISVKVYDEQANVLYSAPLPSSGYFIRARNDGEERNASEFCSDGYYYVLDLSQVLEAFEPDKTYIIEVISLTESESGAMLGAVYKRGGEWQSFPYYIFCQAESEYPLFIEALTNVCG